MRTIEYVDAQDSERPRREIDLAHAPLWLPQEEVAINAGDYYRFRRKYAGIGGAQTAAPMAAALPFIASAHEHSETAPVIVQAPGVNPVAFEFNVPSYGYIRHLWLDVSIPGAAGINATPNPNGDGPFNALDLVTFLDTNAAPIFGPLSGFNTFLANLYGGYAYQQDPRLSPNFAPVAAGTGALRFQIRIPLEISHHDATGCLGNQNSAAPYRVRMNLSALSTIYGVNPSVIPTATITPVLEAWSLPNAVDALSRPQSQIPPNYGSVQFWSSRSQSGIQAGNQTVQVLRVGNLIRNLIFINRAVTNAARDDTSVPVAPIVNWDARQLNNETQVYRQNRSSEVLESSPATSRPAGVYAYPFGRTNQDRAGDDKPWLWLPTVEATRLEWTGTWAVGTGGGPNNVEVLVNDVAPAEVNPSQRYVENSATGFHPNTGANVPNLQP